MFNIKRQLFSVTINMQQLKFEQTIELLILYKKENQDEDVYLNPESIDIAIKWYKDKYLK